MAVVEVDGRTLTLRTAEAAEDAFINGQLTEDTSVFMRDESGALVARPLREIEQFRTILGLPEPAVGSAGDEPLLPVPEEPMVEEESARNETIQAEEFYPAEESTDGEGGDVAPAAASEDSSPPESLAAAEASGLDVPEMVEESSTDEVALPEPGPEVTPDVVTEGVGVELPAEEETEGAVGAQGVDLPAPTEISDQAASVTGDQEEADDSQPDEPVDLLGGGPAITSTPDNRISIDRDDIDRGDPEIEPEPDEQYGADFTPPPAWHSGTNRLLLAIIGLLLLVAAGLAIALLSGGGDSEPDPALEEVAAGEVYTGYAIMDVPVFDAVGGSETGERLRYGQQVLLRALTDDTRWRIIEEGSLAGRYVPASLVSRMRPAELVRSDSGNITFKQERPVRSAADPSAAILQYTEPDNTMRWLGTVSGSDGETWALVQIGSGMELRPGFVSLAENSEETEEPTEEVEQKNERPVAGTTSSVSARCAKIQAGLDRLICQYPELSESESRMRAAYTSAAKRFADAGQQMVPYSQFRSRVADCQDLPCARNGFALQVELLNSLQPPRPRPQTVDRSASVRPSNDPGKWIRPKDYPRAALKEGREGTVGFVLTIDTRGRVSSCAVTSSSGYSDLDEATCRAITRRARFDPARDETGRAVTGKYNSSVAWRLP